MSYITLYLFIFFVCYVPLLGLIFPRIEEIGIRVLWFFFYALITAFLSYFILRKRKFKFINIWLFIMVVNVVVVFVSVSWSNYSYDTPTMKELFVTVIVPFCIAVIALNIFEEKENVYKYIRHLMIASFILSVIAVYQLLSGVGVDTHTGLARAVSTFNNPNALAIFLVLTIPCILYGIDNKILPKVLGWFISACVIGGVIATVSRKGIATMVFAFFLYYILKKEFKKVLVLGTIFAFLGLIISGYSIITQRFTDKDLKTQFQGKAAMAYAGWKMFEKSPLIGLGYKGYYENFEKYFPFSGKRKYDAHNMYISTLSDYGLIGFLPFIGISLYPLFFSFRIVRKKAKGGNTEYLRDMGIICIVFIIPFMISGYFAGGMFYDYVTISLLFANISLVFAARNARI